MSARPESEAARDASGALPPAQSFPPLHDLGRVPRGPVLVVAPHPDDEILGCGGALALHAARGDAVCVALVTSGEAGGDGALRRQESRRASATLGRFEHVEFGLRDGQVAADSGLPERLAKLLVQHRPAVVYAPSPFEMHPDHVAVLDATAAALVAALAAAPAPTPALLLYEVNAECMASFLLDISAVAAAKRAALATFASQLGAIDLVAKAEARAVARTVNVDLPTVTHAEAFLALPAQRVAAVRAALAALAALLAPAGNANRAPPAG